MAVYRTLKDLFKSVGLPLEQDFEMTIHRLKGLHGVRKSPLFRTNYFAFLLITAGKSRYTIDGQRFNLEAHSFYFTNPGHLKSFDIEEALEGYMVTFSETFVKQHFQGDVFQLFPFLIHESTPVMRLEEAETQGLSALFEQILAEYQRPSAYQKSILTNLLMILLYKTKELLLSNHAQIKPAGRAQELVNQFKSLLHAGFQQLATGKAERIPSVKEIAAALSVHPNYLSTVVKDETGISASDWIQDRTLSEAQALLANTTKTVSEIAADLGFTDTAHFSKFFKKHMGVAPLVWRGK